MRFSATFELALQLLVRHHDLRDRVQDDAFGRQDRRLFRTVELLSDLFDARRVGVDVVGHTDGQLVHPAEKFPGMGVGEQRGRDAALLQPPADGDANQQLAHPDAERQQDIVRQAIHRRRAWG